MVLNVDLSAYLTKAESDSKYIPLQIDNKTTVTNNNTLIFNQADATKETIELVQGSSSVYEGYLNPTGANFTYKPKSGGKNSYGIGSAGISYSNSSDTYWITVNSNSDIIQFRKVDPNGDITKTVAIVENLSKVATSGNYNDLINKPNIPQSSIVDSELSSASTNAIQNKVVKAELDKKANIESPTFTGTTTAFLFFKLYSLHFCASSLNSSSYT